MIPIERFSSLVALLFLSLTSQTTAQSIGTKITVKRVFRGDATETTSYWRADRKRMEYRNGFGGQLGPRLATITRCDLGKMFELNLDSSEYVSAPYPPLPLTKEQMQTQGLDGQKTSFSPKPMLRIEIKTLDTGERKQLFGHTARHVVTTRTQTPLAGSTSQPQETLRDGWYIDLDQQISCDPAYMSPNNAHAVHSVLVTFGGRSHGSLANDKEEVIEKPEFVDVGKPETGFALEELVTSTSSYKSADGKTKQIRSKEKTITTELKEGPLDPALFEIPHGFRQVKEIQRNPTPTPLSPVREFWERLKYAVANLFSFD